MTVPATTRRAGPFPGNGSTTSFPFEFKTTSADEVQVVRLTLSGTSVALVKDSDYTVTLNADQEATPGGSITYPITGAALPAGESLTIAGAVPYSQEADLPSGGAYRASSVEQALDRAVVQVQQLAEEVSRAFKFPLVDGLTVADLPPATARANRMWTCDANGNVVFVAPADGSAVSLAVDLLNTALANKGAGMSGFGQATSYPVGSVGGHLRRTISAQTAGCDIAGDVTSALSTAMALAVSLGAEFELTAGRAYQVTSLTIPTGSVLRTNGAVFEDLNGTASNTALVTVQANCIVDQVVVSVPTGKQRDRAIRLNGNDTTVGLVKLTSTDQQANASDTDDAGISILANNVRVGRMFVDGYDRGIKIQGAGVRIDVLEQSRFRRGCWILDSSHVQILGGRSHTLSVNADLTSGNNAFLIGCNTVGATHNITIADHSIEASGEHGIRLGGPETVRNVYFTRLRVRGVGACGIKLRGSDGTGSNYNYNVVIDSPIIEDCGTSPTASLNRCGILAEWVAGVTIRNPIIRPRNNTYCASFGIRVNACNDTIITGGQVHSAELDNLLVDADEADISRVMVAGVVLYNASRNGMNVLVAAGRTGRNIHATGVLAQGCASYGVNVGITGTPNDINLAVRTNANTLGAVACNSNTVGLEVSGAPGALAMSSVSALNSSQWRDGTNTYIRKAGAWVAL